MADTNTSAAPPEQPAAEIKMADLEGHVALQTARGETEIVPVSVLVKDAQMYKSGEQLLAEAKEKVRAANVDIGDAQKWRNEQEHLARDPEGYAAGKLRMATLAKGSPLSMQSNTSTEDDGEPASRTTSATEQRLVRIEKEHHRLEVEQQQDRITREVNGALDEYPVLKDPENKTLRVQAEKVLLAAKMLDSNRDMRAEARDFHSGFLKTAGAPRTAIRDMRQERAGTMPAISPQAGTPDAKALESEKVTSADLRNGTWKQKAHAALVRIQSSVKTGGAT